MRENDEPAAEASGTPAMTPASAAGRRRQRAGLTGIHTDFPVLGMTRSYNVVTNLGRLSNISAAGTARR